MNVKVSKPPVWHPIVAVITAFLVGTLVQIVVFGAYLALQMVRTKASLGQMQAMLATLMVSPSMLIAAVWIMGAAFVGCTLLFSGSPDATRKSSLRLDGRWHWAVVGPAALAAISIGVVNSQLSDMVHVSPPEIMRSLAKALAAAPLAVKLLLVATMAVAPAISEELVFRGFMQPRFERRWGRWPAILLTALAFGLVHTDPRHIPFAFVLGLLLGWISSRTQSLKPAIAVHLVNNSVASLSLLAVDATATASSPSEPHLGLLALGIATLAAMIFVLRWVLASRSVTATTPTSMAPAPVTTR